MARNLQVRTEPMAIWGEENGRRVVTGQHESLVQISISTPQTRRAQQFPVENKAERDVLVAAFEKAIASLKSPLFDSLPEAPVAAARSHTSVGTALPANVVTADMLTDLLARQAEQNRSDMLALVNAMMAAQQSPAAPAAPTAAPSPKTAVPSGNGQSAANRL